MTQITYQGIKYTLNDKYSDKDMTGWDLSDRTDMDGAVIHGLCLSWETPDAHCLPPNLINTTFIRCNMDNVFIPPGNSVIDCSVKRFKAQNDLEDWHVHPVTKVALEPLNKQRFVELGISIDPKDIPVAKMDEPRTQKVAVEKELAKQAAIEAAIAAIPDDVLVGVP